MRTQNSEARIQNSEGNAHPLASHFVSAQLRLHPRWTQNAQIAAVQHSGYWILDSEFCDSTKLNRTRLSACGHAQAGGRVSVPLKSDFLSIEAGGFDLSEAAEGPSHTYNAG
jgi:hypothetical protein